MPVLMLNMVVSFENRDTESTNHYLHEAQHCSQAPHIRTGFESLHDLIVKKTNTPKHISIQMMNYSLPARPTFLLPENHSQSNEMQITLLYGNQMPHKYTEPYANRFVQVKNVLYMHAFEVQWALNKHPEDIPLTKETIHIQ